MTKSRLNSFLERINYVYFHASSYKYKLNLAVLKHVEYLVKQDLLRLADVVVYIFENKQKRYFGIFCKVLLNFRYHFNSVKLL